MLILEPWADFKEHSPYRDYEYNKNTHKRFSAFLGFDVISHADFIAHRVIKTVSLYQATVVKITADSTA